MSSSRQDDFNMSRNENTEKQTAGNWCKSISAFANGSGGTLMLRLDDTDLDPERPMAAVTEQIKREVEPLPEFDVLLQQVGGKRFLVINVFQGKEPPYYYIEAGSRTVYCREGNRNIPIDHEMISSWLAQKSEAGPIEESLPSFDSQLTSYDLEEVSFTKLKALYRKYTSRTLRPCDFEEMGLAREEKLTNAGLLLADEVPAPAKQAQLICASWQGGSKAPGGLNAFDYQQYSGSLLILLQSGIAFAQHNSKIQQADIHGEPQQYPDYPRYCVAEGLVNAFVHCSYEGQGGEIRMDLYDDRLEIVSSGSLQKGAVPQEKTEAGILIKPASDYRNPVIAGAFQSVGCMKGKGAGLKQILETYEKQPRYQKSHEPQLRCEENSCTLVLWNLNKQAIKTSDKKIAKKTVANREKVLEYLKTNGPSKTSQISQLLALSLPRTRALLNELTAEGLIKPNGGNRNRTYESVK